MKPTMSMAVDKNHLNELLVAHYEKRNKLLEEMLDIAWDAVTEAQYEGFSVKLRDFMEV